ncbi:uncharacterized protein G2W53_016026 [Senna tora]|uniref:Uncharacterized protein n=1 Tax=Senna tora TaxID=362788 RepID=A0A834WW11_9FABA|nr:uncharacterized protein G2W53_016026 [Senna tora]
MLSLHSAPGRDRTMRLPEEEHLNHSNLSQIGYSLRSTESPEIDRRMPPSSPADRVIDHLRRRRRCRRSSAHGVICTAVEE